MILEEIVSASHLVVIGYSTVVYVGLPWSNYGLCIRSLFLSVISEYYALCVWSFVSECSDW